MMTTYILRSKYAGVEIERLQHLMSLSAFDFNSSRENEVEHFVASAVILNQKHSHVLMIHHRFLDRWLFPGGHIDEGEDAMIAAFREVFEETGYSARPLMMFPIDIDSHLIPENPAKQEAEHYHHDLLFVGECHDSAMMNIRLKEVLGCRWVPIEEVAAMDQRNNRVVDSLIAFGLYKALT